MIPAAASVILTTGCTQRCVSAAYDYAADTVGSPSAESAITDWLATAPEGFDHTRAAWIGGAGDPISFSDGKGVAYIERLPDSRGFVVTSSTTCRVES